MPLQTTLTCFAKRLNGWWRPPHSAALARDVGVAFVAKFVAEPKTSCRAVRVAARLVVLTVVRRSTVLSAMRSLPQMKVALPQPTASKLSTCGWTWATVYVVALFHAEVEAVVHLAGAGVLTTLQTLAFARHALRFVGPVDVTKAFHEALVTTPLENVAISPPSPALVLSYSRPVAGSST